MSTRTIQFLGQGYGNTPVTVDAVWNGNTIYSGAVPTVNETIPTFLSTTEANNEILFTTDVDVTYQADVPMTITVTSPGALVVGQIYGNYANVYTQTGNTWTITSSGPTTFLAVNNNINDLDASVGDVRNNPTLDGVPLVPVRGPSENGTWPWTIPSGSTLSCSIDLDSGCL